MANSAIPGSKRVSLLSRLSLAPLLIWSVILVLTPNALMIVYSLWQSEDGVLKQVVSIDNYIEALTNPVTISVLTRTLFVAIGASILATLIAYPTAWFVVRRLSKRRLLAVLLVIVPLWISFLIRVYSWKLVLGERGFINSTLLSLGLIDEPLTFMLYSSFAVFLTLTYVAIPFCFVASYSALERLPNSLLEASADSGATPIQTFRTVIWPLTRQGAAIGFSLALLLSCGDYLTPAMVGGLNGTMFGSLMITQFGLTNDWPLGAAMAVILLLITAMFLAVVARITRTEGTLD
jgi:spermidine/putrescine transport system permease protein